LLGPVAFFTLHIMARSPTLPVLATSFFEFTSPYHSSQDRADSAHIMLTATSQIPRPYRLTIKILYERLLQLRLGVGRYLCDWDVLITNGEARFGNFHSIAGNDRLAPSTFRPTVAISPDKITVHALRTFAIRCEACFSGIILCFQL
jgi:hypothetical protein